MLALLLACVDPADPGRDTGLTTDTGGDTAAESGEGTESAGDSAEDSADSAHDTSGDSAVDTASDSGAATCEDVTCVVFACWCGECEDSDIQCVTQAWADANPCALECPIAECPQLSTTSCECDDATGVCVKS